MQVKAADRRLPFAAGALSPALEALLFEAVGGRKLPPVMRVCLRAECPKLGLALHVGRDWAPLAAVRTEAAFGFLEVSLQSIEAQLSSNGEQRPGLQYHCLPEPREMEWPDVVYPPQML